MNRLVVLASFAALAACSQSETTAEDRPTPEETPTVAISPGYYETMNSEGTIGGAQLMEDGSYRLFDRAGADTGNGTWSNVGKRTCFDPAGDAAEICYVAEAPDEDGRFDATSEDGTLRISVRPVADASEIGAQ